MARCHSCNEKLGLGFFSKWVTLDGFRFCEPCAAQWRAQRKEKVLSALRERGDPNAIFIIPRVATRDPDTPRSRNILLGIAAFMDKGICFVQLTTRPKPAALWGWLFGVLGAAAAQAEAKQKGREAYERTALQIANSAQGLPDILERGEQLLFCPRETITGTRFYRGGFEIRMGKSRKRFAIEGGRKAYKHFKPLVAAYHHAIQTGEDPLARINSHQEQ